MPTTSYGHELEIGDDAGLNHNPVCCDDDMSSKTTSDGGRRYTCGDCNTVLTVSANGLVSYITD